MLENVLFVLISACCFLVSGFIDVGRFDQQPEGGFCRLRKSATTSGTVQLHKRANIYALDDFTFSVVFVRTFVFNLVITTHHL